MSEHFSLEEMTCKCGCGFNDVDEKLYITAEKVREILGEPMNVHCACRCKKHNAEVGGVANSQHTLGKAMDFSCRKLSPKAVYDKIYKAYKQGKLPYLHGLFLYNWGVHIDVRDASFRTKDMR